MRKLISLFVATLVIAASFTPSRAVAFAAPIATSFSTTVAASRQNIVQLQGSDADGTPLVFATLSAPAHGTLSGLIASTGEVIYTPTAGYVGADSFTYKVTSGGADSATATVTLTVSTAKTRIIDHLDAAYGATGGVVTFFMTQQTLSPTGIIVKDASVSSTVNSAGQFDLSVYPSRGLSPQAYYNVKWRDPSGGQHDLGVYDVPLATTTVTLSPYRVVNANLAAQYTIPPLAAFESLINSISTATLAGITADQINAALGYAPENAAQKGVANGYAALDSGGKLPSSQLPITDALKIQGRAVSADAPTDGDAIVWDQANATWKPAAVSTSTAGLTSDLVSYYKFEEASGTRADSVGTNHLTAHGTNLLTQAGIIGLAPAFYDADARYLEAADSSSLDFSATGLTVSAWEWSNLAPSAAEPGLVSKLSDDSNPALQDFILSWDRTAGRFKFSASNGTSLVTVTATSPAVSLSTWYHAVGWVDQTAHTINIQVNNGTVYSTAFTGTVNHTSAPLRVGAWNAAHLFTGAIDEVGIWKRKLADSERASLYHDGTGFQYPFEDTSTIVSRTYTYNPDVDFHASGSQQGTTGTISASSKVLTVADAKDFKKSQGILVRFAGASSTDLVTTIKSISGTTITLADAAGTTATGQIVIHDNTVPFQSMLDACFARGGCNIANPAGDYNVSGYVQSSCRAQLCIHDLPSNSTTSYIYPVYWHGPTQPRMNDNSAGLAPGQFNILSTLRSAETQSGAYPALIAARTYRETGASLYEFNDVNFVLENCYVRMSPNPTLTALQLHEAASATVHNFMADTGNGADFGNVVEPTHNQSAGVILPGRNNRSRIRFGDSSISGYDKGVVFSELARFDGNVFVAYAKDAYVRELGYHPSYGHVFAAECVRGLVVLDSAIFEDFGVDAEAYSGATWFNASTTDFFSDPGNASRGRIVYNYIVAPGGGFTDAVVSGFNGVNLCNAYSGVCKRGATTTTY